MIIENHASTNGINFIERGSQGVYNLSLGNPVDCVALQLYCVKDISFLMGEQREWCWQTCRKGSSLGHLDGER